MNDFKAEKFELTAVLPAQIDISLRPVLPECLRNLTRPEQENCPSDVIATYGAAVDRWVEELNQYVTETNQFANEVTTFANSAIDYANEARFFADAALGFANCEAEVLTGQTDR